MGEQGRHNCVFMLRFYGYDGDMMSKEKLLAAMVLCI